TGQPSAAKWPEELGCRDGGKDEVPRIGWDHSRRGISCEMPMGAISGQVFIVAKDDAGGIAAFDIGSGVDKLCNGGLLAVGSDDDIAADLHARSAGMLQRDADNPAVRCGLQLGKNNAMTNFSAGFAGRVNQ